MASASLLTKIQIQVLQYLSFKDLYKILQLGNEEFWGLYGLRDLWESHMDRYKGRCSITKNVENGHEVTWEWIERRLYKIREMDMFIWARQQGKLDRYDLPVIQYLENVARETCAPHTISIEWEFTPDFTRQTNIWLSREVDNSPIDDSLDQWNFYLRKRKYKFDQRMLPRKEPVGHIYPDCDLQTRPVGYVHFTNFIKRNIGNIGKRRGGCRGCRGLFFVENSFSLFH